MDPWFGFGDCGRAGKTGEGRERRLSWKLALPVAHFISQSPSNVGVRQEAVLGPREKPHAELAARSLNVLHTPSGCQYSYNPHVQQCLYMNRAGYSIG